MHNSIPVFSNLTQADIDLFTKHGVSRAFKKGVVLISEGDDSDSFYVVDSGKVRIYASDDQGKEVTLKTLGPGGYFGEVSLFDSQPRSASVATLEPSRLTLVSKTTFERCIAEQPDVVYRLVQPLTKLIRELTENVKSLALNDVYRRVRRVLLQSASENGSAGEMIVQRLTHREIADRVGSSREMVSRIMKDLEKGEYLEVMKDKRIRIQGKLPVSW